MARIRTADMTTKTCTTMDSPLGRLRLVATAHALAAIDFPDGLISYPDATPASADHTLLDAAIEQLAEYFAGRRSSFDLPLAPAGTAFQHAAWRALADIPYGRTISYTDQARALGRPRAVRAVGAANARNPLPIVLPCHRVIGRDGRLVGYGGGLERKRWLLHHERRHAAEYGTPDQA